MDMNTIRSGIVHLLYSKVHSLPFDLKQSEKEKILSTELLTSLMNITHSGPTKRSSFLYA